MKDSGSREPLHFLLFSTSLLSKMKTPLHFKMQRGLLLSLIEVSVNPFVHLIINLIVGQCRIHKYDDNSCVPHRCGEKTITVPLGMRSEPYTGQTALQKRRTPGVRRPSEH